MQLRNPKHAQVNSFFGRATEECADAGAGSARHIAREAGADRLAGDRSNSVRRSRLSIRTHFDVEFKRVHIFFPPKLVKQLITTRTRSSLSINSSSIGPPNPALSPPSSCALEAQKPERQGSSGPLALKWRGRRTLQTYPRTGGRQHYCSRRLLRPNGQLMFRSRRTTINPTASQSSSPLNGSTNVCTFRCSLINRAWGPSGKENSPHGSGSQWHTPLGSVTSYRTASHQL